MQSRFTLRCSVLSLVCAAPAACGEDGGTDRLTLPTISGREGENAFAACTDDEENAAELGWSFFKKYAW